MMKEQLFYVNQKVRIRTLHMFNAGFPHKDKPREDDDHQLLMECSALSYYLSGEKVVTEVEKREDGFYYKVKGKEKWYKEDQLCGTESSRSSMLRKGVPIYLDYTEEGFCAKFVREGDEDFVYRKSEDGTISKEPFNSDSSYLIQDAWNLGVDIPEQMYNEFGKTWK